jgi:hypothetical protein
MSHRSFSVIWQGQAFHFERIHPKASGTEISVWAVSRGGEFVGTMPCALGITTKDFEVRGLRWLAELLDGSEIEKARGGIARVFLPLHSDLTA